MSCEVSSAQWNDDLASNRGLLSPWWWGRGRPGWCWRHPGSSSLSASLWKSGVRCSSCCSTFGHLCRDYFETCSCGHGARQAELQVLFWTVTRWFFFFYKINSRWRVLYRITATCWRVETLPAKTIFLCSLKTLIFKNVIMISSLSFYHHKMSL